MGFSFHDKNSLMNVSVEITQDLNPILESESTTIVDQERRDDDVQLQ